MGKFSLFDDFPAIRKLLRKEQDKEAMLGTNNPAIKMWSDKGKPQYATLEQVENDAGDISVLFRNRMPEAKDARVSEAMFPASSDLPSVMTNQRDIDEILGDNLRRQPIYWADESTGKVPKVIEDALIRERERERIFNTNNPLTPFDDVPQAATELRQIKDAPSGMPQFQSIDKWLEPEGKWTSKEYEDFEGKIREQLEGKRFFFPVKADIVEESPTTWLTRYISGKPEISKFGMKNDGSGSYPWKEKNVFFADGSTI